MKKFTNKGPIAEESRQKVASRGGGLDKFLEKELRALPKAPCSSD